MEIFHQIKSDALRAFLSLFGVSVGIFVVVVSFSLVDGIKRAVVAGFDHFGSDMIMVERFPVVSDGGDWTRYASRPQPSREDFLALVANNRHQAIAERKIAALNRSGLASTPSAAADARLSKQPSATVSGWISLAGSAEVDVACGGKTMRGCKLLGVSGAWQHMVYASVCAGRDFSLAELSGSDAKVILGAKVAEGLFGSGEPCGSSIRIGGRNMTVIGVLSLEGKNIINLYATDYALVVPFAAAERLAGDEELETMIAVGPGAAGRDAAMSETRRVLRAARRLPPAKEDNFALNTMEDLSRQTVSLTSKITAIGLVIALFSLLIGGFGIVNIMLVSVKERTYTIGLKKALGARRSRILMEFMTEALLLSVLGAGLGLLLAATVATLIPSGVITATITSKHIALAFGVAVVLGLASGIAPASQAASLNPVDALRK